MAKEIDFEWLKAQANDEATEQWITRIAEWRKFTLENNKFIEADDLFSLSLGNYQLWFRQCSAFSSIEVYYEIFKENNHFLIPEFCGKDAGVVVDIGANEGFYALKIKKNNPCCKVFCVEPNPYLFEILEKNVETNGINNVVLINKAAASTVGQINLEIVKQIGAIGGRGLKIIDRPWLSEQFITNTKVEAITLDALFCDYDITEVDILKIDVEGMEKEILLAGGSALAKVKKMIVEHHSRELRDQVVNFLLAHNFRMLYEEDSGLGQYYADIYFINENFEI